MQEMYNHSRTDIFENPFDDVNANTITPDKILALWCTPFGTESLKNTSESKFRTQKLPIFLQGSRGTGKTTILKYYSYPVQKERAKSHKDQSLLQQIISEKSIGFYFRCDDSFINTFRNIFENEMQNKWVSFFEHYLELQFCLHLITVIKDIENELDSSNKFENLFVESIKSVKCFCDNNSISNLSDVLRFLTDEIRYIDNFKNDTIFSDGKFQPSVLFSLYQLSGKMIDSLCELSHQLQNITFLILIDEFENLGDKIQQFINTAVKFVKEKISFRIGRRSEGIVTTATINNTEYLREKHDYFLVEISKWNDLASQKNYFFNIAQKRLLMCGKLASPNGIIGILGDKEDLDKECLDICRKRDDHLHLILSENRVLGSDDKMRNDIIAIIRNTSNPIAETINALWVIRSKDDLILAANRAKAAMDNYFSKVDNEDGDKYKNDYVNKYRYTVAVLLASLYKKRKQYYGFNAIVHLSNSNTRTFINICRSIISDAMFYEREKFLSTKTVSKESQNRAILEFSISEFDSICSIISHGNNIRNLILNIGNVFTEFHKDKKARYPETTQFVFNRLELEDREREVIDVAESWSMIIKRDNKQRVSAGINRKGDIYYINRAFCPLFGISYRIRGGVNVQFTPEEIRRMIVSIDVPKKLSRRSSKTVMPLKTNTNQLSFIDMGIESND